jgi:hypothetical protein
VNTGTIFTVSLGQSYIGDMTSDGDYLYGCLVGGPNTIVKIDLATGETLETITGAWTVNSQRGLAADFVNEEFYIGGWNSNQIWRTTFNGSTISTYDFNGVSGLAWHPWGGPEAEGSLWVVESSPNDLVTEIDPNNNWATIQSFTIPGAVGYSGAGAEIKISSENQGALWITNASDNTIYLVDLNEPIGCCPNGQLPANLLGYNIYRDETFVAYTPHVPPGEFVPQGYIDEGLPPGQYEYTVTAVYDLAPYGYPGETGESMVEGPTEVSSTYCFDLEFVETWEMGSFDDNNWLTDGSNWTINGQAGNPAPAAEFTWDPIQTNYESSLTSYPLCAVGMTEGKIWLDFDLKLDAVQPTGEELIQAQVWNWEAQVWNTVGEYSNSEGSFDWTSEHVNINAQAMDKVFKIRFHTMGENSINILGWFIDNIDIYRTCDGPTNLAAYPIPGQGIGLSWDMPGSSPVDEWIHWDDGMNSGNSIGTGGAEEWDVAARWEPEQLVNYEGASVTEVAFFPMDPITAYRVRVWIGASAANLVVDQPVTPVCGQWNIVTLETPVPVDVTNDLWVGYHVVTPEGYPAGVDDGPAIDGYGNMMKLDNEWQTLLQINPSFDFNWNISAHLLTIAAEHQTLAPGKGSRELIGFNVYRNANGGDYVLLPNFTGVDPAEGLIPGTLYCYMVNAVWMSETDECESPFSNEACIIWTSVPDPDANPGSLYLYPNPADDHAYITSSDNLKRITMYDATGRPVMDEITDSRSYELSTVSYPAGIYLVHIETSTSVNVIIITIHR